MKRFKLKVMTVFLICFLVISSSNAYAAVSIENTSSDSGNISVKISDYLKKADQVRTIINKYYLYEVDKNLLTSSIPKKIVQNLKDPYSVYFTEDEYNDFLSSLNMNFKGIGVYIKECDEGIKISGVIENSPAQEAGLKQDDIIIKADNVSLKGMSSEEAVKYIKGEAGTKVSLTVKRGAEDLLFRVERREVSIPLVTSKVLKGNIGYIKLTTFGENSTAEFEKALTDLKSKNVESYIIDLMDNPGGYLSAAINIAGYFIGNNTVVKLTDKYGNVEECKAPQYSSIIDKPVVFLINKNSASASEILSASVKDYKKAVFLGQNTYGKGVAQSLFKLTDGSFLKLTTEKFVSPLGREINKIGISPDIKFDGSDDTAILKAQLYLSADRLNSQRYKGRDRYETSAVISKANWKTSQNVVLVTGQDYADALSSVTLAKKYNAPILLTKSNTLSDEAESEIKRLQAENVFIVGGKSAVSETVEDKLKSLKIKCTRIEGKDRYETSAKAAGYEADNTAQERATAEKEAVLVSGSSFADALSAASYAAFKNMPVLLVSKSKIPQSTQKFIKDNKITKVYVIGGQSVISDEVLNALPNAERISGNDRYLTNIEILKKFQSDFKTDNIFIASGLDYADALSAAAAAARNNSPVLLTGKRSPKCMVDYMKENNDIIKNINYLGNAEIK